MRGENEKLFPNSNINTNSVQFAKIEKEKSRFTRSIYRKKTEHTRYKWVGYKMKSKTNCIKKSHVRKKETKIPDIVFVLITIFFIMR